VKTKVPKKAKTRTSKTSSGSTGLFHNWNQWKKTVVAGEGGKDAKHFLNKELLWTVLFCFLLFLMYCIMTLLPLYLIVTPLVGLTGIYFREILWGAGVHTAAAVRTKWKSLPPQSVEHGTSDIGPKVEGREAANFRDPLLNQYTLRVHFLNTRGGTHLHLPTSGLPVQTCQSADPDHGWSNPYA
jgi:hypothetical protein